MNVSLLKTTECETIFYSEGMEARVKELEDESGTRLRSHRMATLDELLSRTFRPYSYEQNFDEVETKPILVAHTSGSTGKSFIIVPFVKRGELTDNRITKAHNIDPWCFLSLGRTP